MLGGRRRLRPRAAARVAAGSFRRAAGSGVATAARTCTNAARRASNPGHASSRARASASVDAVVGRERAELAVEQRAQGLVGVGAERRVGRWEVRSWQLLRWTARRGVGVPEHNGERGPAPGDPGPHGAGRDAEDLGDLRVVEVAEVAQHDRGPEILGDAGDRGVDVEAVPDRVRSCDRGSRRVRSTAPTGWAAAAPSQLVDRGVRGDPVDPGSECGAPVEPFDGAGDGDHRVLGRVERVVGMADDAAADSMNAISVTIEQHVERFAVAAAASRARVVSSRAGADRRIQRPGPRPRAAGTASRRQVGDPEQHVTRLRQRCR